MHSAVGGWVHVIKAGESVLHVALKSNQVRAVKMSYIYM